MSGTLIAIRYIGTESRTLHLFNEDVSWDPQDEAKVPEYAARQLLEHKDLFELVGDAELPSVKTAKGDFDEEEKSEHTELDAVLPRIDAFTKSQIVDLAKRTFGVDLNPEDLKDNLIGRVRDLARGVRG